MAYEHDQADEEWVDDDGGGDDEDDVLECPSCRESVHEDTQQCPRCGDWIVPVYPGERRKRVIWIVAAVLVLAAFTLTFVL